MSNIDLVREHPAIGLAAAVSVLIIFWSVFRPSQKLPRLPYIGKKENVLFATARATFNSLFKAKYWLDEGYEKYSKNGKAYIFPDISGRHEIIVPNNKLRWLVDHPDNVVSVRAAHYDMLMGDYAFTSPYLLETVFHEHVIHKNLARKMDSLIPDMWDELIASFQPWGFERDWSEIRVWDDMMRIISRISNRMFVGLPLCRNEDFLKNTTAFAQDVISAVALLPLVPRFLHPIVGHLMCIPNHVHYWRTRRYTLPHINSIMTAIKEKAANPASKVVIPDNYISWHIQTALAEGRKKELDPAMISRFLMPIEFAAIHTTTLTITMTLFDLFGSDPKKAFIEGIREEAERVFKEHKGVWSKKALTKLVRADSAIRESMRYSNFGTRGVQRKVIAKEGIYNEAEGWRAPYGSFIALNAHSRHHDPEVYSSPDTYDAFRFSRPREQFEAINSDKWNADEYLKMKNISMISTGEDFIAFGHGRHACPGRFLVQHELKMLLAYLLMNYEIPYLPERPANHWFGTALVPPTKATIKVRRRADAVMDV